MSEKCVICGVDIPEGRQVCLGCEETNFLKNVVEPMDIFEIVKDREVTCMIEYMKSERVFIIRLYKNGYRNSLAFSEDILIKENAKYVFDTINKGIDSIDERIVKGEEL